jgi:adenylate cyclase
LFDVGVGLGAVALGTVVAVGWRLLEELLRRRHVTKLFAQYVPDKVARQLVDARTFDAVTAGQRLDLSVVFCDLRGFTPLCATLDPHEVREVLDLFYERATEVIMRLDGTVVKFVGDEVLAVFGAPLPQSDHAERAIACARSMLVLHPELCAELGARGLPPIEYGIGVNSGDAIAAHTGSEHRRQYDVLGGTVNVGSRLCGQARANEAVISETTVHASGREHDDLTGMGPLTLKGVDTPLVCYRLCLTASTPLTDR